MKSLIKAQLSDDITDDEFDLRVLQGRRRRGGWGGSGRPSFSLLSTSVHERIISLAVALKYGVSKIVIELLCPSVVAKSQEYAVSGIVRQLACNGENTLEQPPTKIAVSAR